DPTFVLLSWSAGLALSVAFVSLSRIVGPGYTWLAAGVALLIGLPAALAESAWWARCGILLVGLALLWARNHSFAGLLLLAGGLSLVVEGSLLGGMIPTLSAALALGGVTGEMALGHWYLVDPRMPRWALRSLAVVAIVGLFVDTVVLRVGIGFPSGGGQWAFWMLVATSIVLMFGVLGALRQPAYSGVMAATGLSYLAVLTTLGAVFLGRALAIGLGPFA
ncbi:MAG: hypothetical protein WDZ96_00250, partial [Acidimicrobiia bacterium]